MPGFDGQGFEHRRPKGKTLEERIAGLMAQIRAVRMRNPGWDTSSMQRELDELRKQNGQSSH